jgi:hypothetical protein
MKERIKRLRAQLRTLDKAPTPFVSTFEKNNPELQNKLLNRRMLWQRFNLPWPIQGLLIRWSMLIRWNERHILKTWLKYADRDNLKAGQVVFDLTNKCYVRLIAYCRPHGHRYMNTITGRWAYLSEPYSSKDAVEAWVWREGISEEEVEEGAVPYYSDQYRTRIRPLNKREKRISNSKAINHGQVVYDTRTSRYVRFAGDLTGIRPLNEREVGLSK